MREGVQGCGGAKANTVGGEGGAKVGARHRAKLSAKPAQSLAARVIQAGQNVLYYESTIRAADTAVYN